MHVCVPVCVWQAIEFKDIDDVMSINMCMFVGVRVCVWQVVAFTDMGTDISIHIVYEPFVRDMTHLYVI